MSRRKQSKPRQIKRSLGDLEEGEDNLPDDLSLSGDEGGASDQDDSAECDTSSPGFMPPYSEEPRTEDSPSAPDDEEDEKGPELSAEEDEGEAEPQWDGPDELCLSLVGGVSEVIAQRNLTPNTVWGPYSGHVHNKEKGKEQEGEGPSLTVVSADTELWLKKLPVTSSQTGANCTIYGQGQELYCKVTQELHAGDRLLATLFGPTTEERSTATETHNAPVKEEEPAYPAALHSEIQLLPQQAGMAAILATAVINKDIFPCKDCGIWYRSERNLQAHLMYYCASRQKQDPASPPPEKPRDSYPNERVCPFPHCNKSCPSASSLEIHMRTHSGERPFVCLICLSAFTTKANCERHLKVHTDTLNGVCHGCGFVSTTRDILYSHLVTCHMVCQPGSRSEVYSPGPGLPPLPLATGLGPPDCGVVLKCQVCGFGADSPALLQQHVRTHLEVRGVAERSPAPADSAVLLREPRAGVRAPARSDTPGANGAPPPPARAAEAPGLRGAGQRGAPSDSENEGDEGRGLNGKEGAGPDGRPGRASVTQTPPTTKTPPSVAVKAEPPSPTPGSSPAHQGGVGAGLPGGAVFLPQYMFGPEAILPQASEILAKMSEMVHSRLKQGHAPGVGAATAAFYTAAGSPIQKGATCFECDITFNNVNNFYVHKRLYCSSRHQQQGDTPAAAPIAAPQAKDGAEPPAGFSSSSPVSEATRAPSASRSDTEPPQGAPPTASAEACNIRFSRHENYMVHKRFYCASRHDPSNQRPHHSHGKAAAFLPQPVRTRKRKKMYEIHMARAQALARSASTPNPAPTPTTGVKQEGVSAPSPGTCPEGEGPIDLSKRPRLREPQRALPPAPPLPLTDYHKCTACCISFNSIENYLAHKAYYCPATPLQQQQRPLEQLHKLRRPASTSPAPRPGLPELHAERLGVVKGAKIEPAPALHSPLGPEGAPLHFVPGMKALGSPQPPMVCPYCPQSGGVVGDLMEHFRTTHGLVLALQPGVWQAQRPHPLTPPG
ncbi:hypothetical protein ANANG_G00099600 [Anguilla anguilla]|uniref:Zinc finger protein ZFPM1 n=1 Tax=Anguilla anguilla TaxID=7936 RepID=A0A9D3S101_ANGAN|nr:hypothetical protein ANANG_G00099600 [Anguilla anguilla]